MKNEAIRELLGQDQYNIIEVEKVKNASFEALNYYGETFTVFDDLLKELGRVPSQREYIQEYIWRAKAFFTDEEKVDSNGILWVTFGTTSRMFRWNEGLVKAIINRAGRTYQSLLVEYTTAQQLKNIFPNSKVVVSGLVDMAFGSDIVLEMEGKITYIHVFSNTYWGHKGFSNKAHRPGRATDIEGKRHCWKREWSVAHSPLAFGREEDNMTEIINGNPLFKEEALKQYIENIFSTDGMYEVVSSSNETQLGKFIKWCEDHNIDYYGTQTIL